MKEETDKEPIVLLTGVGGMMLLGKEPIKLFTAGSFSKEDNPLGEQLGKWGEELGGRFVEWEKLLEEKGVDRVELKYQLSRRDCSTGRETAGRGGRKTNSDHDR